MKRNLLCKNGGVDSVKYAFDGLLHRVENALLGGLLARPADVFSLDVVELHERGVAGLVDQDCVLIFDCEKFIVLFCEFEGTNPKDYFYLILVSGLDRTAGSQRLLRVFFHVFDFDLLDARI
jgi:hypothetical protein